MKTVKLFVHLFDLEKKIIYNLAKKKVVTFYNKILYVNIR